VAMALAALTAVGPGGRLRPARAAVPPGSGGPSGTSRSGPGRSRAGRSEGDGEAEDLAVAELEDEGAAGEGPVAAAGPTVTGATVWALIAHPRTGRRYSAVDARLRLRTPGGRACPAAADGVGGWLSRPSGSASGRRMAGGATSGWATLRPP